MKSGNSAGTHRLCPSGTVDPAPVTTDPAARDCRWPSVHALRSGAVSDDLPQTIGAVVTRAAERFGDAEAFVDGEVRCRSSSWPPRSSGAARAFIAAGIEPGDRVAIWAPELRRVGRRRARPARAGRRRSCRSTPASRARRRPTSSARAGPGSCSPSTASSAPTTWPCSTASRAWTRSRRRSSCGGRRRPGPRPMDGVPRPGRPGQPGRRGSSGPRASTGDDTSDILFTSRHHREPQGRDAARHGQTAPGLRRLGRRWSACGRATATSSSTPSSTPSGYKAGILACAHRAGPRSCPSRCSTSRRRWQRAPSDRITMLPGPPAIYQTILNHPDLERFDMSSLRLAVTGAAPVPVELVERMQRRARLRDGRHRLRAHRGPAASPPCAATTTTPRRSPPPSGRAIPGVEVRVVDDDGQRGAAGRARRDRRPGLQRDAAATSRTPSRRPRPSTPTAGCTPATSA